MDDADRIARRRASEAVYRAKMREKERLAGNPTKPVLKWCRHCRQTVPMTEKDGCPVCSAANAAQAKFYRYWRAKKEQGR